MGREEWKKKPETGLYFCIDEFPPSPQRFLRLLEVLSQIGYTTIFVEWGGSFPWSLDERFSDHYAYPPDAVYAIEEKSKDLGMTLVPIFPVLGCMRRFLSIPAYSHLRANKDAVELLDSANPGSQKFLEDLLDDMLALIPKTSYVLIPDTGLEMKGAAVSRTGFLQHIRRLATVLNDRGIRPIFRIANAGDWGADNLDWMLACGDLVANRSVWSDLNFRHALPAFTEPRTKSLFWLERNLDEDEIACPYIENASWAHMLTMKKRRSAADITEPFIEICLDIIATIQRDTVHSELTDQLDHSIEIRKTIASFDKSVSECWNKSRMLRELLYRMTVNCQCRERYFMDGLGLIDEQKNNINQCISFGRILKTGLAGRVNMAWLDHWINTRLAPLHEELSSIESRVLQLGT